MVAISCSGVALAGQGVWTSGGPYCGYITALVIDPVTPTTLYAAEYDNGVFKSTDAGGTWASIGGGQVFALAIDPRTPSTVYAGKVGGVLKSTDSGGTWSASGAGLPGDSGVVDTLAVDPATPSTLYAGTKGGIGIFKSTDAGGTWVAANSGLPTYIIVNALAIDPAAPATLYAGTQGSGVFKSTDAGGTWAATNAGLPSTYPTVNALAIDPAAPATLYAGMQGGGVFKSIDRGGTWVATNAGLPSERPSVQALAIDPTTPATLYAGMGGGGVFKSTDSGGTWTAANVGLPNLPVSALAISSKAPSTTYAGIAERLGGVFRSTDSGASWTAVNKGIATVRVNALAVDPAPPAALYAGTFFTGVFKSTDSGVQWVGASSGLEGLSLSVNALAVDPASPATLYAGAQSGGVFKSTDAAGTWGSASSGLPNSLIVYALAINPRDPRTIYAGGLQSAISGTVPAGLFRSVDAGRTWSAANAGLPTNQSIRAIAVDPVTAGTLYAGTSFRSTFKSTDAGGTWVAANSGMPSSLAVYAMVVDPATPSTVYAGTGGGLFKSTDGGGTWTSSNTGLPPPYATVNALVIDPATPSTLYAGTGRGVFRSTDSGTTWGAISAGLPSTQVLALALDSSGPTTLHAALESRGVWQVTLPMSPTPTTALIPSSARAPGTGGAFYTTDLTVADTGTSSTTFVLKFLGHDADGRGGPEKSFSIAAGESKTFSDVLESVFGLNSGYGAIGVTSPSDSVRVLAQTSTPGFGGSFGQSVPAARPEDLIIFGSHGSLLAVREDAHFRTNLILANATEAVLGVDVHLLSPEGTELAAKSYPLPPLGMTQVTRVVRDMGVAADVNGARLVLSTATMNGAFAAYASVIDNVTNDPRTLLPIGPIASARPSPDTWLLPSSARASGAGSAFYTTDVAVAYSSNSSILSARFTLKFLGNNGDGRTGPEVTFDLGPQKSVTYIDVLGSVFQRTSDFGAIRASLPDPYNYGYLAVVAQTSTPGFGGTFGQSVPAATAVDLIRPVAERSILAVREDDFFRTNLILANATGAALDVDVRLVSTDGTQLATKRYPLAPLGMTQVTKVVRDMGIAENVAGVRIVLSTPTTGGAFAAYASVIDNVTNDPRTLLPR